jgi:hypothetical protein
MHRDNPYHNFEHSSHVCMHVAKFLSRIQTRCREAGDNPVLMKSLHDRTYRVAADPMTQFAMVFASLLLSVDHPGVPNSLVAKAKKEMSRALGGKSVSEANAFLLAWDLLLDTDYRELRQAIASTKDEAKRFRQIVVSTVLATDTSDDGLQSSREERWSAVFSAKRSSKLGIGGGSQHSHIGTDMLTTTDLQITAVVELLMQCAESSHSMQHFQVHNKWNERLFLEAFKAYRSGRAEQNPAETWYEDHLKRFDEIILPMAGKIKECGIFGTTSDEMMDFAAKNRYLWKENGRGLVKEMAEKAEKSLPVPQQSIPSRRRAAADSRDGSPLRDCQQVGLCFWCCFKPNDDDDGGGGVQLLQDRRERRNGGIRHVGAEPAHAKSSNHGPAGGGARIGPARRERSGRGHHQQRNRRRPFP